MAKFVDYNGLLYFLQKLTSRFVSKEAGKGLSTNDYTNEDKQKLSGIEANANNYTLPIASDTVLGGVKVGSGLTINQGVLSASGGGTADSVDWSNVQNKPTTVGGYGITDAYTKTAVDSKLNEKANTSTSLSGYGITDAYTKTAVDSKLNEKANASTSLSGYGITDAYTKSEVDGKLSSVYKPAGAVYFADLPAPSASNVGYVYSVNDAFTTDDRFLASEPVSYPIGTNVVVIAVDNDGATSYLFDVLSGFVDLSGYLKTTDMVAIENSEIDSMFAM